ncbi:peptidoglycan editing factor PgeF [Burkholderiales bacterium]|nr:peptidoglycan editing factor PgeF [Burkholderiales bacterium]
MSAPKYLIPQWSVPNSVRAIFTTRQGGTSKGDHDSLNLSYTVGDDHKHVSKNRELIQKILPSAPFWVKQVHGSKLVQAEHSQSTTEADALYTQQQRTVCSIMTADCLPVLITNTSGDEVAVAHAGWRGLAEGILENTVRRFSASSTSLIVQLGPAISQKNYQVKEDLLQRFLELDCGYQQYFLRSHSGQYFADLYGIATHQLKDLNVKKITGGNHCTFEQSYEFFSHRRSQPTGRMAAMIWLDDRQK